MRVLRTVALLALAMSASASMAGAAPAAKRPSVGRAVAATDVPLIERAVLGGPWSQVRAVPASCPVVHVLISGTCPYSRAFSQERLGAMDAAGIGLRLHYVPADSQSLDLLAEVAARRNWVTTLQAQFGRFTPTRRWQKGDERAGALEGMVNSSEAFRVLTQRMIGPNYTPGFIWQDRAGQWRIQAGYSPAAVDALIASLNPDPACLPPKR